MSELLTARGLTFGYGEKLVLSDVSLELVAGRVTTLIGPNGSGKSTLIKLLCGHLHGTGEIDIKGQPLRRWRKRMLARTVAYLPQSPTYEASDVVSDVLRMGRACYWGAFGLENEHDLATVKRVATLLALEDLLDRRMDALSGGQRQRVFIGRCLVQEPSILFLDEPNTYLDLKHQVDLLRLLRELAHEHHLAVLMASHDLNLAGAFADELALLANGRLIARGDARAVLTSEIIGPAYGLEMCEIDEERHRLLFPKLD